MNTTTSEWKEKAYAPKQAKIRSPKALRDKYYEQARAAYVERLKSGEFLGGAYACYPVAEGDDHVSYYGRDTPFPVEIDRWGNIFSTYPKITTVKYLWEDLLTKEEMAEMWGKP